MLRRTIPCWSHRGGSSNSSSNHQHHHTLLYDSIVDTVGRTPIVKLQRVTHRNVYVKLEYFNPLGLVKDRLAVGIMDWAEQNNLVQPGQTVVEASSGNTVKAAVDMYLSPRQR
jgi:threonine synthase